MSNFRHFECFNNNQLKPGFRSWLEKIHEIAVEQLDADGENWLDVILNLNDGHQHLHTVIEEYSREDYFRSFYYLLRLDADQYASSSNNMESLVNKQLCFDEFSECSGLNTAENGGHGLSSGLHAFHIMPGAFMPAVRDLVVMMYLDYNVTYRLSDYSHFKSNGELESVTVLTPLYSLAEIGIDATDDSGFPDSFLPLMKTNLLELSVDEQVKVIQTYFTEARIDQESQSSFVADIAYALLERSRIRLMNGDRPETVLNAMMASCDALVKIEDIDPERSFNFKEGVKRGLFISFPNYFRTWCPDVSFEEMLSGGEADHELPIDPAHMPLSIILNFFNTYNPGHIFLDLAYQAKKEIHVDAIKPLLLRRSISTSKMISEMQEEDHPLVPMVEQALVELIEDGPAPSRSNGYPYYQLISALSHVKEPSAQLAMVKGLIKCLDANIPVPEKISIEVSDTGFKKEVMHEIASMRQGDVKTMLSMTGLTQKDFKDINMRLPDHLLTGLLDYHMSL